jgi:hypothetical protein
MFLCIHIYIYNIQVVTPILFFFFFFFFIPDPSEKLIQLSPANTTRHDYKATYFYNTF